MIEYRFDKVFKKSGKSLRQLGELTGVGFVTLHKLANARNCNEHDVSASTVNKICSKLGIRLNDVMIWKTK